jgi:hypothetical protein
VGDRRAVLREFTSVGAGDADTAAGEDDGLAGGGIDTGVGAGIRAGIRAGVRAGVRFWRSIGFVININVSIGRDAGVDADDDCDECGGVRIWRGAGRGSGAECRGRD